MKPTIARTSGLPLACQAARLWFSVGRETTTPSRHLATCPGCQSYLVSINALQLDLRRSAGQTAATPAPGLESRIIDAVRLADRPTSRESSGRLFVVAVASCAAALLFVVAWQLGLLPFPGHPSATQGQYATEVAALVAAVRALPADLSRNLESPTAQLARDNSLGHEVENVYSDARSALDFLALNFLPASSSDSLGDRKEVGVPRQT
jgi:hypothetical protein